MKRSVICKLSIAFAVCCGVICGIAIAPLVIAGVLAIAALICLLGCVVIYLVGLFVWLFSFGRASIFGYASSAANFGLGLFSYVTPVAAFSCQYMTPIAGYIAIGAGILGIIFASIGLAEAKKQAPQPQLPEEQSIIPDIYKVAEETEEEQEEPAEKKKKAKKKKTAKGVCAASLAVSIVFTVLAGIAIIVASALMPVLS